MQSDSENTHFKRVTRSMVKLNTGTNIAMQLADTNAGQAIVTQLEKSALVLENTSKWINQNGMQTNKKTEPIKGRHFELIAPR